MLATELFDFRVDYAFTSGVPEHRGSDKEETYKLVMDTAFDVSVPERQEIPTRRNLFMDMAIDVHVLEHCRKFKQGVRS